MIESEEKLRAVILEALEGYWRSQEALADAVYQDQESAAYMVAGRVWKELAATREWQSIETAPTDGTAVLLAPNMCVGTWDFGAEKWLVMNVPLNSDLTIAGEYAAGNPWFEVMADAFGGPAPTHWMPLPAPPRASETTP
jgi:hypothetical protein